MLIQAINSTSTGTLTQQGDILHIQLCLAANYVKALISRAALTHYQSRLLQHHQTPLVHLQYLMMLAYLASLLVIAVSIQALCLNHKAHGLDLEPTTIKLHTFNKNEMVGTLTLDKGTSVIMNYL